MVPCNAIAPIAVNLTSPKLRFARERDIWEHPWHRPLCRLEITRLHFVFGVWFYSSLCPGKREKVKWDIEGAFLAISEDRDKYLILSQAEASLCKSTICKLHKAKFSREFSTHCEMALYLKETKSIMKNCMLKKEVLSTKPVITWLSGNAWLLESARGQKVNIICGSKIAPIHSPRVITIQSNLEVLNLESACWIENAMF